MTKLFYYCKFKATAFENLIRHPKVAIRQLDELRSIEKSMADEDQLIDLADQITGLVLIRASHHHEGIQLQP